MVPGLRSLRAVYFFHAAATGLLVPYLVPFLETRGVQGNELGYLLALRTAVSIGIAPLFGLAADRAGAGRTLRFSTAIATAAIAVLLTGRGTGSFVPVLALLAVTATVAPLADAAILGILERGGAPQDYGKSRLFGSIGFAISALLFGFVFRAAAKETSAPIAIIAAAALSTIATALSLFVPPGGHGARPRLADIPRLLRCEGVAALLLTGMLQWVTLAPYHSFFGAHVGDPNVVGVSINVAVAVEIVVMALAPWWLERFRPRDVLALSALAGVLRWAVTSSAGPAGIIAAQTLHGLSYGAFFLAMVDAIVRRTPAELRGTAQALIAAISIGAGSLLGNLAAGPLFAIDHGKTLFLAAAGFSVVPAVAALTVKPLKR